MSMMPEYGYRAVPDVFALARNKLLFSSSDYDAYIDSRVSPSDRIIAYKIMALMPLNLRGDFVYLSPSGHRSRPAIGAGRRGPDVWRALCSIPPKSQWSP